MHMDTRAEQLFQYLLAMKQMEHRSIRHIKNYQEYRYMDDFPEGVGCWLFGTGSDPDAWIEVKWMEPEPMPEPDPLFHTWLKGSPATEWTVPSVHKDMEFIGDKVNGSEERNLIRFEEDIERVKAYSDWMNRWQPWAAETKRRKVIQEIYDQLFFIYNQLERGDETYEIVIGHGVLSWSHPKEPIVHPLLMTRMEIFFDASKGSFILKPTQKGTAMEVDVLQGLDIPCEDELFMKLQSYQKENLIDPRDETKTHPLYQEIAALLHPKGSFLKRRGYAKEDVDPVIIEGPVWLIRKQSGKLWIDELNRMIQALKEGLKVPAPVQALLQVETIQPTEEETKKWSPIGEELYFPLPSNEEQRGVVKKLAQKHGVVVQGPPGTGKSHTIANLIAHLLAHGKKVLVTSQKEPALRVLADKLPPDIRRLCVSVLGGDSHSLREVEASIESISQQMDRMDTNRLAEQIERHRQKLQRVRERIAKGEEALQRFAIKNHEPITWKGEKLKPMVAARVLEKEEKEHGWFPDKVTGDPPITDADLFRLWQLASTVPRDAPEVARYRLPAKEKLLSPSTFLDRMKKGEELKRKAEVSQGLLNRYPVLRDAEECARFSQLLNPALQQKGILEAQWLRRVLEDALAGGERRRGWSELIVTIEAMAKELADLYGPLTEHRLDLPDKPPVELREGIHLMGERLTSGKGLGTMFFVTSGRKVRLLYEETFVDGRKIRTTEDTKLLQRLVNYREKRARLVQKWNEVTKEIEGPTFQMDEVRLLPQLDDHRYSIEKVLAFADSLVPLREWVEEKFSVRSFSWSNPGVLEEWANAVGAALREFRFQQWISDFEQEAESWMALSRTVGTHPVCDLLAEAWRAQDFDQWYEAYDEAERLIDIQDRYHELLTMLKPMEDKAPLWTRYILERLGNPGPFPERWQEAWHWKRVQTHLDHHLEQDLEKIQAEIHDAEEAERRLIEETVTDSSWREQLLRITEQERRALHGWKQKIKRIGKGTGKYADKYRREAREEMEQCQSAIPVWIMPIQRVIENLSLTQERFDVVIVDESSQCDIFSLVALMRADRAIVVGDDQQISPQAVGVSQEIVRTLINHNLQGLPQSTSFDSLTSLYDMAIRVFGNHVMLKEHFRSVPEIVGFSNDLSYNREMVPLRLPTLSEQVDPPVLAKRVKGIRDPHMEVNEEEAAAIVNDIAQMVDDPVFQGQSMGVITLLGQKQAPLIEQKLRDRIGEEKMVQRKILCGDAYTFQGDERDIIFLSMVVGSNVRFMPLTKSDARQRLNVAVSRARNQLRLYHSIDLDHLHPQDLRHRLLSYCLNPMHENEINSAMEMNGQSELEGDVLQRVVAEGYRVTPHVKVGHERYFIDLVIEGQYTRLAVECDGDQWDDIDSFGYDRMRQKTLERAGWTFWRICGSQFYRDPEKALEPLWMKLREMGIEKQPVHQI
ncbi:AAA domain-containing protein [Marininema halotolerans]|nr:AAA domain-containing protein [Marininema halotolerans]